MEHAITRGADAATSLILLWVLAPESFAKLALAQATVAPTLLLFVSPEAVMYRDFAHWKSNGDSYLASQLHSLRTFAWAKGFLALIIASLIAFFWTGSSSFYERFFSLVWAYALALSPQIAGPDREYLRLSLKLKHLNGVSLWQKLTLLGGTAFVSIFWPGNIGSISAVAVFSTLSTALLAAHKNPSARNVPTHTILKNIKGTLKSFTLWTHLSGVISNWVQTLDLFFLSLFSIPTRMIGLYATALKLSGLSLALPLALSNLFGVWVGRRTKDSQGGLVFEMSEIKRLSLWLLGASTFQAFILILFAPGLIQALAHGRWTPDEQTMLYSWVLWILGAAVIQGSTFLLGSWLTLRTDVKSILFKVTLPWMFISIIIYGATSAFRDPLLTAKANLLVSNCLLILLWMRALNSKKTLTKIK